ncbi:unnamed protein product [Peronospora effusa]|uniref:Jacalin-type lectin domain-containing protein n=1 Tax=Peronospora effusa TaxID=542832 RepID=A0A425CFD5_9STRA|nr:hypothetical protein DD237_003379 [Peronospora effusa]CAI5703168.1 unnamed protein product [Peronospora effusa]
MLLLTLLQAFVLLCIIAVDGVTLDEDIQLSEAIGGSGGTAFSDIELVKFGQSPCLISIRAKKRITSVALRTETPTELMLSHGGLSGTDHSLFLKQGEYVNAMEINSGRKFWSSRIFYLKFTTNRGNSIEAGTKTNESTSITAPIGFQLSGFFGRAESELDQLGLIWTRINATTKALTDTMGSDWYGNRIRNWVGHTIGDAKDTACYRKREQFGSGKSCPLGYNANGVSCLAQCPLSYPVTCYEQCIPQNDDCTGEILAKSAAVVAAIFNAVTAGVSSIMFESFKKAKQQFLCAANIVGVVKSLIYYLSAVRVTAPQGTTEELLTAAYQSDVVLFAMPMAVATCLGVEEFKKRYVISNYVYITVEVIVKQVIVNGDQILSTANNVFALLQQGTAMSSPDNSTVQELQVFLDSNTTCGFQLKNLTDHITAKVSEIRNKMPTATVNDIRVEISDSPLLLTDIPVATNNCMREIMEIKTLEVAFQTRDLLRKTLGTIVDQLVETNQTDMGRNVAEEEYFLDSANMALTVLGGLDPSGLLWMMSQFVQPVCGPTAFIGEIDDGTLYDALGLKTMGEAFKGSYGTWTKEGDGKMDLIFESIDTKDVTVVIHSGSEKYQKVRVPAGSTVNVTENIANLQDKVLYLDRWRQNVIGIPLTAGGSLTLWVPRASQGGHLRMHVRINVS